MTTLSGENYKITLNEENNTIILDGTLRLRGLDEYQDISLMLDGCLDRMNTVTVDLKKLDFLNSSGIAMLSRFVINARKNENTQLNIVGSESIPWQGKSLQNLKRLMPSLSLEFE